MMFDSYILVGRKWTEGIDLGWEGGELDWDIFSTLQKRYESVSDRTVSNISVWIDTNEVGGYKVLTQVNYIWPRVTVQRPIVFPLTALGNESLLEIPVNNPSSFPLLVHAVLADDYGSQWTRYTPAGTSQSGGGSSSSQQSSSNIKNVSMGEPQAFRLSGVLSSSSHQNGSMEISDVQLQLFRGMLLMDGNKNIPDNSQIPGLTFVVPPGFKYFLRTSFKPQSKDITNTVILLRNNLTGIEAILAKGRAGTGQLTVGSGPPGSALLFQLTEKLLQACQTEPTSKYVPPQLTVRRSFVARNIGEIPLDIRALEIYPPQNYFFGFQRYFPFGFDGGTVVGTNVGTQVSGGAAVSTTSFPVLGEYCEGYGFRILNCHPFTLQPNHTHSIDIAFSPDFTMSKVVRTLRLVDSTGGVSLLTFVYMWILQLCSKFGVVKN